MGVKLFIGNPGCETKLSLKMGFVKMHGFHGNPLYDSREWGGDRPTNQIHSRVLLILEH